MGRLIFLFREGGSAALILIPVFWILWRRKLMERKKALLLCLFSLYLCCVYALVGLMTLPMLPYLRFEPSINLIPFAGLSADSDNAFLNVVFFIPLGIFLPLLWQDLRKFRNTAAYALTFSLIIELMQLLSARTTDINDLITNVLGAVIGYGLFRILPARFHTNCCPGDRRLAFAMVGAVMFFVQPYIVALTL